MPKLQDTQLGISKIYALPENSAGGLGSRRECCWGYVSVFENTTEKLIFKSILNLKVASFT